MKPTGDNRRTGFPAVVCRMMLGISGVVLCGCATDPTVGTIRGGGQDPGALAGLEAGAVAVAKAPAPALFQFDRAEGKLDTGGRRAGELAAEVLALPPMGDPLFQTAASPLVVAMAPFAAAYGAVAGSRQKLSPEKYSEAEAELAEAMAAIRSQEHLRKWFLASAGERTRLTVGPAETFNGGETEPEVSTIVETRVEEVRLGRKGKDDRSYALTIKARARVVRASDGTVLYDRPFEYESRQALFLDWVRGDGLASVAQTGFRALAEQMVEATLCAPAEQAVFTGAGYRKERGRRAQPPAGTSIAQLVKLTPSRKPQPAAPRPAFVADAGGRTAAAGFEDSLAVFATRSQPGMAVQEPVARETAGSEAVANTEHFLDGTQDFPNTVVILSACIAAIPVSLWNQGVALAGAVPQRRLRDATAALRKAALETRPDAELADRLAQNLGVGRAESALLVSNPSSRRAAQLPNATRARVPETALEIQVVKAGLTGGEGFNPRQAFTMQLQVRLFRTADGKDICSYPVHYRSERRRYTAWAAEDARLFREECARCYAKVSNSITRQLVSQGFVAPARRAAPVLVQN